VSLACFRCVLVGCYLEESAEGSWVSNCDGIDGVDDMHGG
jgi:hypothetical protein